MRKTLLVLLSLGLGLECGINAFSQSSKEEIPEAIKSRAAECLKRINYCPDEPIIKKIEQKTRYREMEKDSVRVTLYNITNDCFYFIPNYLVYTQTKLEKGRFSEKGEIEEIISRDKDSEPVPLKDDWWEKLQ
jgi:hypothetical protein